MTSHESFHPIVDFEFWAKKFPRDKLSFGTQISSPKHLCQVELVRRNTPESKLGKPVPADIFLWEVGPPRLPYLTKIGGAPYRDASLKWPSSKDGRPHTFICQFCFLDSGKVVDRKLPGEVLLVFRHDDFDFNIKNCGFYTEWVNVSDTEAISIKDCPKPGEHIPELAGVRHRTHEYPESKKYFDELTDDEGYLFPVTQSTKISPVSFFCQGDPRPWYSRKRLICTLNSVLPTDEWPFINLERVEEPVSKKHKKRPMPGFGKHELMFGDLGTLYFFLKRSGKVKVYFDCY